MCDALALGIMYEAKRRADAAGPRGTSAGIAAGYARRDIAMCGYVCFGCGRCGKPRTLELPDFKCFKCGALNEPGATRCVSCGEVFVAPGVSGAKGPGKAKVAR